jgi:enamine deaminase RidA (YjgF/YER057c/UK114 family)
MHVQDRLKQAGIILPKASSPVANYVPFVVSGKQIFISGQVPVIEGSIEGRTGKVGKDFTVEQAQKIARICALNVIAQLQEAVKGALDTVYCIKLGVFVNATDDFTQHSDVANGASDVMVEVFGEKGKHARFAVGAPSLPRGVAVEVDAVFGIG